MSEPTAADDPPPEGEPPQVGYVEAEDETTAKARRKAYLELLQAQTEYVRAVTDQKKEDKQARKPFLWTVSLLALGQLVLADIVFLKYASEGVQWDVPAAAISAWLAATVAQVIAVLLVLANNLFPKREGERLPDALVGPAAQEPPPPPVIALPPPPNDQARRIANGNRPGGSSSPEDGAPPADGDARPTGA